MFKHKTEKITYAIIGLGRFGYALALELAASGAELVVIDKDEEKVREMRDYTDNAFVVHSLDKKTLCEAGIQNCDVAVVCIGEHIDTSILTTLTLVGMGIKRIIAKAKSSEHGEILKKLGAEVVYPEKDMAVRLANSLENSRVLDYVRLSEKISISKLFIPESAVGKTVYEMNFRSRFGLNIIAIENSGEVTNHIKPDYVFKKNDILFLVGEKDGLKLLDEWNEKH